MPTLPLILTVTSAPDDLVTRVTLSAGYELQGQKKSAGTASFDAKGGTFQGTIESDPLGQFPAAADIEITVDYTPQSGLQGFSKSFQRPVTAAGVHFFYDVPKQLDRQVLVAFSFLPNQGERILIRWDHLVGGEAVRGEAFEVVSKSTPAGRVADPASVLVKLKAHPEKDNKLQLRANAATTLTSLPMDPFDQAFPVESQSVVLSAEAQTATTPHTCRLVAKAF
jgi:hypothetical protein